MYKPMVRCLVLVSLLMAATNAFAEECNPEKYQDLFYPNGMPTKEGWFGEGPTVYEYYDEAEIPAKNLLFILYSEKILVPEFTSADEHTAFLAVVKKKGSKLTVIKTIDVTKYITVELEIEGGFEFMSGALDIFPLKKDANMLHLNVSARLSGTGAITSSSDVFFLVDPAKNTLLPALELLDTATFGRSGRSEITSSYATIYTLNNKQTGTQILTQYYKYELDYNKNIDQGVLSPDIHVYEYDSHKKKYSLKNTINELPSGAAEVGRTFKIDTKCTSGCYDE